MQKTKYRFYNLPKEYSLQDYKDASAYIVKKYSDANGLLSIYNWGNVSVPGISDIDIILVFDGKSSALPFLKRSFYFLDENTRYLARHPFIFIDDASFRDMMYVNQHPDFRLLYGKKIKIKNLSNEENLYCGVSMLNDIIIRNYPRDFIAQFVEKKINVRDTLLRLNSLKYSIKTMESMTKKRNEKWNGIIARVSALRKGWFKKNDFESLILLNEEAIHLTMELIEEFCKFIKHKKIVSVEGSRAVYNGIKNKSVFREDWDKEAALDGMIGMISKRQHFHSILPLELSAQLIEYSTHKGIISSYIRKNIRHDVKYQLKHKNFLAKRINIFNKQVLLASRLRHSDFAAFFDFGYRTKEGINNWALNMLDKVRF